MFSYIHFYKNWSNKFSYVVHLKDKNYRKNPLGLNNKAKPALPNAISNTIFNFYKETPFQEEITLQENGDVT